MRKNRIAVLLLGSTFVFSPLLGAKENPSTQPSHFISSNAVDATKLLPDPPSADSEEYGSEIKTVLDLQASRTPEQIERAKSEQKLTVFAFANVLGPWFTAERCPQTAAMFAQLDVESKTITKPAKSHWNRPRPTQAEPHVHTVIDENEGSYPSGHSTRSFLYAEILSEIFPQQRAALMERARQIGWDRVIAGVHYPSDVAAGRTLGQAIAQQTIASADFQAALQRVRDELTQSAGAAANAH